MTTLINADTSGGLKLTSDTSGALDIQSAGSTKLSMDSSGNVDIVGTVTGAAFEPDGDTAAGDNAAIGYTAAEGLILTGQGSTSDVTIKNDADVTVLSIPTGSGTVIVASVVDAFRIGADSVGSVPVISESFAGNGRWLRNSNDTTTTDGARHQTFFSGGTEKGSISTASGGTTYNTSSDYRLKENVSYSFDATTRLKQLKPARFNFIVAADKTVDGFLAHEVSSIVPEAITGTKDAVDGDGNPIYQGIDQSKLVPLLVKTIQELEARITALEAE